ncbi:metallophosphoesterase [Carboxylicivirga sp. RSCT41]|uniref:metallophosphoesterase n=1 Tax=Carboxylicivirga agarovorans TaxID=3417570 RepID=UPI003D358346
MIVQYYSDLHLEFPKNKAFLKENPIPIKGDILILAGDIVPIVVLEEHDDFWDFLSNNFQYVYWVPGNHEFYYGNISACSGPCNKKIRDNIMLVNNTTVALNGVRFIFSTLWTAISPANQLMIQYQMPDFKVITDGEDILTPEGYNRLHAECLRFLTGELAKTNNGKTVVVTHHVPTYTGYPERYKGDILNEAFAVELKHLLEASSVDYWIFGHHHQNTCRLNIGQTQLLSSQLGYVHYNEHLDFNNDSWFEV